jgi:hypothetical protein
MRERRIKSSEPTPSEARTHQFVTPENANYILLAGIVVGGLIGVGGAKGINYVDEYRKRRDAAKTAIELAEHENRDKYEAQAKILNARDLGMLKAPLMQTAKSAYERLTYTRQELKEAVVSEEISPVFFDLALTALVGNELVTIFSDDPGGIITDKTKLQAGPALDMVVRHPRFETEYPDFYAVLNS